METPITHLEMYFEMTLENVDRVSVINKWQKEIALLDLPFESMKKFIDLMISPELREKHFTDSWKEELYKLRTDKGSEFTNKYMKDFLRSKHIYFFTTQNSDTKANYAERVIQTLKSRIYRYFTKIDQNVM